MAWTAARTWVTNETVTAALLNTHLRDQLQEFESGTNGDYLSSSGGAPTWSTVGTSGPQNGGTFDLTNTSFLDFDAVTGGTLGTGVATTATVTFPHSSSRALILWRARVYNSTANAAIHVGYRISGGTTQAADDTRVLEMEDPGGTVPINVTQHDFRQSLGSGSTTFELQARVTSGTGFVKNTEITVFPF